MTDAATKSETIADGFVHAVGVIASIAATVLLIIHAAHSATGLTIAAVAVYGGVIILSFVLSATYNLWPWDRLREGLRRLDHAAIFLKIAGTYTPLVVLIGSVFGYILLGVIWAVAISAATAKVIIGHWPRKLSLATYLLMGWAAVLLIGPMIQVFGTPAMILIAVGGGLYTVGTIFYAWETLRFQTAIWHSFVLAASGCFFGAITLSI